MPYRPIHAIAYEGRLHNDPERIGCVAHLSDMDRLDAVVQAWAVSGELSTEKWAIGCLLAWAESYEPTGNPINENKLEPLLLAAYLFQERIPHGARGMLRAWVKRLAEMQMESVERQPNTSLNNWHPKRLKLIAWAGLILSDSSMFNYSIQSARGYIDRSLRADGSSVDIEQRDSLGYHIGGLKPLVRLAALLFPANVDLYHYEAESGASPARSVAFVVPYATGEKQYREFVNTKVALDRQRAAAGLAHYQPGRIFSPEETVSLWEASLAFEPQYVEILRKVTRRESRYPTWPAVMGSIGWVHETIGK